MTKIDLTEQELKKLSECLNNKTEVPQEILQKLSPSFFEKLAQEGHFDYQKLDRFKIPTIEYAGKRTEASILSQATLMGGNSPLQIERSFSGGKLSSDTQIELFEQAQREDNGWRNLIVQGDNLQFLKTCYQNTDPLIKNKVKGKVKLIYIDPPFGTGDEYGGNDIQMSYSAKSKGSEFIEIIRERIIYLREILNRNGVIVVRIDYHFGHYLKIALDEILGKNNFVNEIIINRISKKGFAVRKKYKAKKYPISTDSLFVYSKTNNYYFEPYRIYTNNKKEKWHSMDVMDANPSVPKPRIILGKKMLAPPGRKWMFSQENIYKKEKKGLIKLNSKGKPIYKVQAQDYMILDTNWTDISGYSFTTGYPTENSEILLERVITSFSNNNDLVMDVFAGSGTTAAVAEKLGRRWIMCDFGKHAIYTMQKRMLEIDKSKALGKDVKKNQKYGRKAKPFCMVSVGAYDFSRIMNLRKNKDIYIKFVLGLFGLSQEKNIDLEKKYKLSNIYCLKEGNPVEVYPVWEDEYLKNVRIDEEYLKDIVRASGGKLKGEYYIVTPETCTIIDDTILKNSNNEEINFKLLKFPYKILEDISRHFQLEQQPSSKDDINKLISSAGFYFNEKVTIKLEKINDGFKICEFDTPILNKQQEKFDGIDGLSMLLVDTDYDEEVFNMDYAIYSKEIKDGEVKIKDLTENSAVIAVDKHGNESKVTKINN
jgi:adenine-specific DNA-methyltransferase